MTAEAHDASVHDTIPKLLLRNAQIRGARPAMREKDLGIWQTWTWADTLQEVRDLAMGLRALGLKRGDRIAIVGDNRPRLYWAICSAQWFLPVLWQMEIWYESGWMQAFEIVRP